MGRYRVKRVSVTKTPRRKRAGAKRNPTARRRNGEFDNLTYSLVQSAAGAGRASGKEWGTGKPTTTRMDKEFRHWFEYRRDTFNLGVLNAAEKKQLRGSFFAGVRAGYQSKPNPYRVSRKRKAAVAKRTGAALAKYVRRRRNSKTGAGGWPLVPSTRFPGESTLACPKCGSTNVTMSVHYGPGGRLGDLGALQYNRCGNCGHQTHYKAGKSNPRRKAAAKGKAKRFTVPVTRGGKSFKLTVAASSLAAAKRAAAGWRP